MARYHFENLVIPYVILLLVEAAAPSSVADNDFGALPEYSVGTNYLLGGESNGALKMTNFVPCCCSL